MGTDPFPVHSVSLGDYQLAAYCLTAATGMVFILRPTGAALAMPFVQTTRAERAEKVASRLLTHFAVEYAVAYAIYLGVVLVVIEQYTGGGGSLSSPSTHAPADARPHLSRSVTKLLYEVYQGPRIAILAGYAMCIVFQVARAWRMKLLRTVSVSVLRSCALLCIVRTALVLNDVGGVTYRCANNPGSEDTLSAALMGPVCGRTELDFRIAIAMALFLPLCLLKRAAADALVAVVVFYLFMLGGDANADAVIFTAVFAPLVSYATLFSNKIYCLRTYTTGTDSHFPTRRRRKR